MPPTRALRPVNPGNAWSPRIADASGTQLAAPYSPGTVLPLPWEKEFTLRRASSSTRDRWVTLAGIAQDSRLLPPVGVGPVSQCPSGRPPSQAGYPS